METNKTSWVLNIEEDPETGDGILTFPSDLLEKAGWKEGDVLTWVDQGDGSWSLTKKEEGMLLSEFVNDETNRTAVVYKQNNNYGAKLYRGEDLAEDRVCEGKSLCYVEDLAENWINKWGEFKA